MVANQIECCKIEQSSVIKFWEVEKCKLCEIYARMCDVYGEAYFSPNGLNMSWPLSESKNGNKLILR